MAQKEVTDKEGNKRVVVAENEADLKDAAKAVEAQSAPTYPNINVPVEKGHDIVEVEEDLTTRLVDGRGAHNSPKDAAENDGQPEVPVVGANQPSELKVGEGLTDAMVEDAKAKDAKVEEKADKK